MAEHSKVFERVVFLLLLLCMGSATANHITRLTCLLFQVQCPSWQHCLGTSWEGGHWFVHHTSSSLLWRTWLGLEPSTSQVKLFGFQMTLAYYLAVIDQKCFHSVKERSSARKRVQFGHRPNAFAVANELSGNYLLWHRRPECRGGLFSLNPIIPLPSLIAYVNL